MSALAAPRLDASALPKLRAHLLGAPWAPPGIGIVHLGLGNFHRAHQALYTEEAMLAAGGQWGICGVIMRGSQAKQASFRAQDGLYTLLERGPEGIGARVVRSLRETLLLPTDAQALLARLCDPAVRIVSLTVTEKGYCLDRRTDALDTTRPEVQHDLAHPLQPLSVPGVLVAALAQRRRNPFALMSCDNLPHNGATLRKLLVQFARLRDAALADWIAETVAFPSTMVDRITPATVPADIDDATRLLGYADALAVSCEPFRQWVVEDRFPLGRPAWEQAGAQLVADVAPYEQAKLRMLNGTHSAIAYLSMLAGFATVDQAMAHAPLHALIHAMLTEEVTPTLDVPARFDRGGYRDALLQRFANPALKHACAQIAMDGSQKLPQRLVAPLGEHLAAGKLARRMVLAVGAWMQFVHDAARHGAPDALPDPMHERLIALARTAGDSPAALAEALLGVREIFSPALAASPVLTRALAEAVAALRTNAREAIAQYR